MQLTTETVRTAVAAALLEDQAADDVTTRWSVPETPQAEAVLIAEQAGARRRPDHHSPTALDISLLVTR
ncbi:hypothetical protein [Kribbella sp. NPDC048915]|uniref:hypothetical protein n=1 Tax=Kribbella sp. NPDC048915 TaxID=3155148 RepID=UPI0033C3A1B2